MKMNEDELQEMLFHIRVLRRAFESTVITAVICAVIVSICAIVSLSPGVYELDVEYQNEITTYICVGKPFIRDDCLICKQPNKETGIYQFDSYTFENIGK